MAWSRTRAKNPDTRPVTVEITEMDQRRDDDARVINRVLETHMLSDLHTATAAAAATLHHVIRVLINS